MSGWQESGTGLSRPTLLQAWEHSHLSLLFRPSKKSSNFIRTLREGHRDGGPCFEQAERIALTQSSVSRDPCSSQSLPRLRTRWATWSLWPLRRLCRINSREQPSLNPDPILPSNFSLSWRKRYHVLHQFVPRLHCSKDMNCVLSEYLDTMFLWLH